MRHPRRLVLSGCLAALIVRTSQFYLFIFFFLQKFLNQAILNLDCLSIIVLINFDLLYDLQVMTILSALVGWAAPNLVKIY